MVVQIALLNLKLPLLYVALPLYVHSLMLLSLGKSKRNMVRGCIEMFGHMV